MRRVVSVAILVVVSMWLTLGAVWAQGDNETRRFDGRIQSVNHANDTITLHIHEQGDMLLTVDRDRLDEDARRRYHHLQPGDNVSLTAHFSSHRNAWRVTDIDMRHDDHDHHHDDH